jgi:hypothetical protein
MILLYQCLALLQPAVVVVNQHLQAQAQMLTVVQEAAVLITCQLLAVQVRQDKEIMAEMVPTQMVVEGAAPALLEQAGVVAARVEQAYLVQLRAPRLLMAAVVVRVK